MTHQKRMDVHVIDGHQQIRCNYHIPMDGKQIVYLVIIIVIKNFSLDFYTSVLVVRSFFFFLWSCSVQT
jgi:hypothetical protein